MKKVNKNVFDGFITLNNIPVYEIPFKNGDFIKHKIFGECEVLSIDGKIINLKFKFGDAKKVVYKPEYF